jgi:predicted MFS family arabinose efflux permease
VEASARSSVVTPQFLLVVGATLAVFASFGMLLLALPLYARDVLGASDLGVGLAIGSASLGSIVAGPPAGRVADRRGARIILVTGAAAMAAGYLVLALEPPLSVIVPVRVIVGAAEAAFVVAVYTAATDLVPTGRHGEALSLVTAGSYGGLAVGPIGANLLLDGDRFPLVWVVAALSVAGAGVAAFALPARRPHEGHEAPRGWLPPRAALLPGLVLLCALIGFGGFNAFAALYAREIGLERPGLVFAVFAGVVVAVRIVGRRLPDRLGARTAAGSACVLIACGLVVIGAWPSVAGLLVGTAVFAGGQAFAYPAIALLATARAAPVERSAAVGAVIAFVDVALATGAFVLGAVANSSGYRAVFFAGALSAAVGLAVLWRIAVRPSRVIAEEGLVERV